MTGRAFDVTTRSVGAFFAFLGTLLDIYTIWTPLPQYRTARAIRHTRQEFEELRAEAATAQEADGITSEEDDFEKSLRRTDHTVIERLKREYLQEELERKKEWMREYREKKVPRSMKLHIA